MLGQFSIELHSFRCEKSLEQFFERQIPALFHFVTERDHAWSRSMERFSEPMK